MATSVIRRIMLPRTNSQDTPSTVAHKTAARRSSGTKRPHSPEPNAEPSTSQSKAKRAKALETTAQVDKAAKRAERQAQRTEFREKYTQVFPSFVFYFDLDHLEADMIAARDTFKHKIAHLGGRVDHFFSREVTHLITNRPIPSCQENKENCKPKPPAVTPILVGRRIGEPPAPVFDLLEKAQSFDIKIWSTSKLENVLRCCLSSSTCASPPLRSAKSAAAPQPSLTQLLESERLQGTTTERDPTQRRHDYHYFSPRSYFVLVEDIRGELATIAAHEYDARGEPTWPVLYCDPDARNPFVESEHKDRKRSKACEEAGAQALREEAPRPREGNGAGTRGDLKRSVSMTNLPCASKVLMDRDEKATKSNSINASGYLASGGTFGYTAASGNSVGITSTTGTTSTADSAIQPLPPNLRGLLENHVVTSRKVSIRSQSRDAGVMGPPEVIPDRAHAPLRKSKSTNTMRLPKREEGTKPGYCEPCREKFEDGYQMHTQSVKHRKYATSTTKFVQLDAVLARVQRRTLEQAREEAQLDQAVCEGDQETDKAGCKPFFAPQPSTRHTSCVSKDTKKDC